MAIVFWSVRVSAVKRNSTVQYDHTAHVTRRIGDSVTTTVTTYDVGGAMRHELNQTVYPVRTIVLATTVVIGSYLGISAAVRGWNPPVSDGWIVSMFVMAFFWLGLFLFASGSVIMLNAERIGKKMADMARASHGAHQAVRMSPTVSFYFGLLGPDSGNHDAEPGDVILFSPAAWDHFLESQTAL